MITQTLQWLLFVFSNCVHVTLCVVHIRALTVCSRFILGLTFYLCNSHSCNDVRMSHWIKGYLTWLNLNNHFNRRLILTSIGIYIFTIWWRITYILKCSYVRRSLLRNYFLVYNHETAARMYCTHSVYKVTTADNTLDFSRKSQSSRSFLFKLCLENHFSVIRFYLRVRTRSYAEGFKTLRTKDNSEWDQKHFGTSAEMSETFGIRL